jgi:hypothetical protein
MKSKYAFLYEIAERLGESTDEIRQIQIAELKYLDALELEAWEHYENNKDNNYLRLLIKLVTERIKIIGTVAPKQENVQN